MNEQQTRRALELWNGELEQGKMFTESHPVIRKLISDRFRGAFYASLASIAWSALSGFMDADTWPGLLMAGFGCGMVIDAWLIRWRVRRGHYGNNAMEAREVLRALDELRQTTDRAN